MDNSAKLRLIYIAQILYDRTDCDHTLSTKDLMRILEEEYNTPTHRTTIPEDVKLLQDLGMDIQCQNISQHNQYSMVSRYFDDGELKLLIDAVASSRFISKKESALLIEKISRLAGRLSAPNLTRNISVERRIKTTNIKSILRIVDYINAAINQGKQIEFKYFEYDANKTRKMRHNGEKYRVSPYRLVWNGEYYYVVAYYEKYDKVTSFRVDRIATSPKILDNDIVPLEKGFDLDHHLNTMYHMFSTERRMVTITCDNDVMDAIIDRFGEGVDTSAHDNDTFTANVEVAVNKIFFSWIFGFEGKVKIAAPADAKEMYREMVMRGLGEK